MNTLFTYNVYERHIHKHPVLFSIYEQRKVDLNSYLNGTETKSMYTGVLKDDSNASAHNFKFI